MCLTFDRKFIRWSMFSPFVFSTSRFLCSLAISSIDILPLSGERGRYEHGLNDIQTWLHQQTLLPISPCFYSDKLFVRGCPHLHTTDVGVSHTFTLFANVKPVEIRNNANDHYFDEILLTEYHIDMRSPHAQPMVHLNFLVRVFSLIFVDGKYDCSTPEMVIGTWAVSNP